jgi:hypothetical protein
LPVWGESQSLRGPSGSAGGGLPAFGFVAEEEAFEGGFEGCLVFGVEAGGGFEGEFEVVGVGVAFVGVEQERVCGGVERECELADGVEGGLVGAGFVAADVAALDFLKIEWMTVRRMLTGDESPSIGYTQIDLPTYIRTVRAHPELALDERHIDDDFWLYVDWQETMLDEDYAIQVAAFVLADNEAVIRSRLSDAGVLILPDGTVDVDSSRTITVDRLVAASYNIRVGNVVSGFSDGAYDGAVGDRYVFGSYANNRVTDMWNLTWVAGAS